MGYRKNFYLNDDMDVIFCEVRKELSAKGGKPIDDISAAAVFKEIFKRADEHKTCGQNVHKHQEIKVPELDLANPAKYVEGIEKVADFINELTPEEANSELLKLVRMSKEKSKPVKDRTLYGANSYVHMLKECFQYKEAPLQVIWLVTQAYYKMLLAARAQGQNINEVKYQLWLQHLKSGKADFGEPDRLDVRSAWKAGHSGALE